MNIFSVKLFAEIVESLTVTKIYDGNATEVTPPRFAQRVVDGDYEVPQSLVLCFGQVDLRFLQDTDSLGDHVLPLFVNHHEATCQID